jgi:hypothetical protein
MQMQMQMKMQNTLDANANTANSNATLQVQANANGRQKPYIRMLCAFWGTCTLLRVVSHVARIETPNSYTP